MPSSTPWCSDLLSTTDDDHHHGSRLPCAPLSSRHHHLYLRSGGLPPVPPHSPSTGLILPSPSAPPTKEEHLDLFFFESTKWLLSYYYIADQIDLQIQFEVPSLECMFTQGCCVSLFL
uniref:Uncharacterized protein n=1 Tax=Zea mays TaxID=4577 RepID=A0A804RE07_MAIZE